jgi:hypothetical protein
MEGVRKSLQVTLENCEFAKEFHYFLTVQLDGEGEKVGPIFLVIIILEKDRRISCSYQSHIFSKYVLSANVTGYYNVEF